MKGETVAKITRLIQQASEDDATADKAATQLISIGIPAVQAVIEAIKSSQGSSWRLCNILLKIRDPEIVSIFIDLMSEENANLAITAFEALGQSENPRAFQALLEALSEDRKYLAVKALGEFGNSEAIEPLLEIIDQILAAPHVSQAIKGGLDIEEEDFDDSSLELLPDTLIALAKLGDDSQASLALDLSRYSSQDPYSQADIIRAKAVKVFQHVVVPGSFSTLQRALHDTFNEVRLNAIDALFYLGVKQSISELINYVEDENYMVINNTLARLGDLLGKKIESGTKIDELREWWKLHQVNYEQFICYRLGKPINLKKIIFLLKKRSLRDGIIKELKIITGQDFSLNCVGKEPTNTELIEHANKWWEREGHQFQVGHLYKYGHEKEIESVF